MDEALPGIETLPTHDDVSLIAAINVVSDRLTFAGLLELKRQVDAKLEREKSSEA